MNQFIIIGTADDDTQTAKCLLTRRVFTSLEAAEEFVKKQNGRRNPEIIECYLSVPDSLYRHEWRPAPGFDS